jgi:hypothetical protein
MNKESYTKDLIEKVNYYEWEYIKKSNIVGIFKASSYNTAFS